MRIFCSICKDIYIPDVEVLITNCGHLYHDNCITRWCNHNKTCPQCRTQLKFPLLKVFFDVDKDTKVDCSTLEYQIGILTEKLHQSDSKNKKLRAENEKKGELLVKLEQGVEVLKEKNSFLKSSVKSLKDQIVTYTKTLEAVNKFKNEIESLKIKFAAYQSLDIILNETSEEAQNLLKKTPITEFGVKQLSIYVSALKDKTLKDEKKIANLIAEKKDLLKLLDAEQKKLKNIVQENINPKDSQEVKQLKRNGKKETNWQRSIKTQITVEKPLLTVNIEFPDNVNQTIVRGSSSNSSSSYKHWENLVTAGPSRNAGSTLKRPKANLNQSAKRFCENESYYAFDGMGGRKKIGLGNPTPKEEFEKIINIKSKQRETVTHKKILDYYKMN